MRKRNVKEEKLDYLISLQRKATRFYEWRILEAIWLREKLSMSGAEVGKALGYRTQTVHLIWHRWKREGRAYLEGRHRPGGRNRAYLTYEQEEQFLLSYYKEADEGKIVTVKKIKKGYEQKVGKEVAKSTIYRLLYRHGWRKLAPRKRHPKSDPKRQDEVKKT